MHWRPVNQIDSIKEIESEIEHLKKRSPNLSNILTWVIPLLLLSFVVPLFPNRTGARPLIESIGYIPGVILSILITLSISLIMIYREKQNLEKRLTELNLRKKVLKKRTNNKDEV